MQRQMRPFCHLPLHLQWLFKMLNYFVYSYTLIITWKSATQEQLEVFCLAQHQVHLLVHLYIYKYWSSPLVASPCVLSGAPWTVSSNAPQTHLLFFRLHSHSYHGTVIRTGITCKKIPCYMRDSACRWFIVKKAKIFLSYVKHFWILAGMRKCRILIGLWKQPFLHCPNIFLD